jgi:small basic protein
MTRVIFGIEIPDHIPIYISALIVFALLTIILGAVSIIRYIFRMFEDKISDVLTVDTVTLAIFLVAGGVILVLGLMGAYMDSNGVSKNGETRLL